MNLSPKGSLIQVAVLTNDNILHFTKGILRALSSFLAFVVTAIVGDKNFKFYYQ